MATALKFNRTLVKLDLSRNCLKSCVAKYILEACIDNVTLSELDLSGNFLDDYFARDFANVLKNNQSLYKVDIGNNPIGPEGAEMILEALRLENDTLGDLGNLDENMYMGVRIRELLK